MKPTIRRAESGELQIVTSTITITEVIKLRGKEPITSERSKIVVDFFENDYLYFDNLDRELAMTARELVWDHNFDPKDAIHVATALRVKDVSVFHTFDEGLIKRSGNIGSKRLDFRIPDDAPPTSKNTLL